MRLKQIRLEKGLSQSRLADLSGIDTSNISRLETGDRSPNLQTIKKVADALEISLDEIYYERPSIVAATKIRCYENQGDAIGENRLAIDPDNFAGIDPCNLRALNVSSDEMAPTILPCDTVIFNLEDIAIQGGVFIFKTPNGMALGRIVFSKISGSVTVKADNPNHKDIEIADPDSLTILGRVIKLQRDIL